MNTAIDARHPAKSVVLISVALGVWLVTFAWFRVPEYVTQMPGLTYVLFPIAWLSEGVVLVLTVVALVFAIIEMAHHRFSSRQAAVLFASIGVMLIVGPPLLMFGGLPI